MKFAYHEHEYKAMILRLLQVNQNEILGVLKEQFLELTTLHNVDVLSDADMMTDVSTMD